MSDAVGSLHAEELPAVAAWEFAGRFDALDRTSSFACSSAWNRAAAATLGEDRLVHVLLRDDAHSAVGLLCLERSASNWRSGSPGRPCLRWPLAELGYHFAPRWDPEFPEARRSYWLRAVCDVFPRTRIELQRTSTSARPAAGDLASPAQMTEGAGTWSLAPVHDRESYLAGLNGKHRRDLAKYRRDIASAGGEWVECGSGSDELAPLLDACFALHERRLSEKSASSAYLPSQNRAFIAALVTGTRENALRLSLLRCDGRLVAGCLSFAHHGRYWAFMSGWDRSHARLDLGRQVIYHQILREFERGLSEIDLLGGDLDYKREFGLAKRPTIDIVVHPDRRAARRERLIGSALDLYRGSRRLWANRNQPEVRS